MSDKQTSSLENMWGGRVGRPAPAGSGVAGDTPPPNTGDYQAWGIGHADKGFLDLRTKEANRGDLVPVHLFLGAKYDREVLTLAFPDRLVTLQGQNLERFREDFAGRRVGFVQEFDPGRWPSPPPTEPIVFTITVMNPRPVSSV